MTNYCYVTKDEVQKVCKDIGIGDWSGSDVPVVCQQDADKIRKLVGSETRDIPLEEFAHGLEIELEHGTQFGDANVTNNHPILTGRIVLAHLKEGLDYYLRLECMELEMELAKAIANKNADKSSKYARELSKQRMKLDEAVAKALT